MEHYGWCVGALWVVCGSIMEHYGWCVGALWVVWGSIRERNYRLKKKELFIWAYLHYWGGLISGVHLYYKAYFGTFQSGQNTEVATFQGS